MTTQGHSHEGLLGAHALGLLDADERARLEEQIEACEVCQVELANLRALEAELGEVPPEYFLEGPPEDGALLLQRTLRQVREEHSAGQRRRTLLVGLVAAAVAAVLAGGGFMAGKTQDTPDVIASRPSRVPAGAVVTASATDAHTEAKMTVDLMPASGWVRVKATVSGLRPGDKCRLVVLSESGEREIAGSWLVGKPKSSTRREDLELLGFAAVPVDQVKAVVVENDQGKSFVEATV